MRKLIVLSLSVLTALAILMCLSPVVVAADTPKAPDVKAPATVEKAPTIAKAKAARLESTLTKAEGTLTKIDGKSLTVTVETKADDGKTVKNDVTISIDDKTKVNQREGSGKPTPAKFEDLKLGQAVRAFYTKDTMVASTIVIVKPAAKTPEAPKAPAAPAPAPKRE